MRCVSMQCLECQFTHIPKNGIRRGKKITSALIALANSFSNGLQWRLQYSRIISLAGTGTTTGVENLLL